MKNKILYRLWMPAMWVAAISLTGCVQRAEESHDNIGAMTISYEEVPEQQPKQPKAKPQPVAEEENDSIDYLHTRLERYAVERGWLDTDTICHYPTRQRIRIGSHQGIGLYLTLGELHEDLLYDGAKVHWGDSLIYSTDYELTNDWLTCQVIHADHHAVTYVLLLINDRPNPDYWHILYMDEEQVRLIDYVTAGNDYVEGGHYFHDNIICADLDGDGITEIGGKYWTELWADSMTYQPCYIYKLDRVLQLDEHLTEQETRKANKGLYLGLKNGLHVLNPDGEVEEDSTEE